jgi:hypothetical protein
MNKEYNPHCILIPSNILNEFIKSKKQKTVKNKDKLPKNIGFLKKLNWISLINIFSSIRQKINKINERIRSFLLAESLNLSSINPKKKIKEETIINIRKVFFSKILSLN